MGVKTQWKITYKTCGHTEVKDLSTRPPDKRAGFARWAAENSQCTACWRQANGRTGEWVEDKREWLARKRAEEQQAADEWASKTGMPELSGTDKQVAWANRIRHQLLHDLYDWAVQDGHATEEVYDRAEEQARTVDRARWWIDNREQGEEPTDPETLLELLAAVAETGDGTDCENTY